MNITFSPTGFLEKNRDTFSADLIQLIQVSKNKFLQNLFVHEMGMVSFYFLKYNLLDDDFIK